MSLQPAQREKTLSDSKIYNPLHKKNLAESIVRAILTERPRPLSTTDDLSGSGVYIIYYCGSYSLYEPVAIKNTDGTLDQPIYIGKAIPKGGRKGGFVDDDSAMHGTALRDRIGQHQTSIREATNLEVADFSFRTLVVDPIFIPLGENMLIERFRPVWNLVIDGFGNKDPGKRRKDQYRSAWDVLHPGRSFVEKLANNPIGPEKYAASLRTFFETGKVVKPKKPKTAEGVEQPGDGDDS